MIIEVADDSFAVIGIGDNTWHVEGTYEECREFANERLAEGEHTVIVATIHCTEDGGGEAGKLPKLRRKPR